MLWHADWGGQRLALRFSKGLLDENSLQPYLWEYSSELEPAGEHLILDIAYPDEDGGHWFEGEARLSALAPLRDEILSGDYRALYLAWLLAAAANDGARSAHDEELEPPVSPGLKELSTPLAEFVRFFQLDPLLVQAAAQASEALRPAPTLALKFSRRLQELAGPPARHRTAAVPRTWVELCETAEQLWPRDRG